MATPIEDNTAALEALKEKAASLPEQSSGSAVSKITFSSIALDTIGMSCYQKGNTHSSFYNLEYGDSVTVDNLDLSGRITLVGGYADAGGTKKDVYYFYLTFEGDTLKIDGMYIMDI